jgi:predicted dehydrogenase
MYGYLFHNSKGSKLPPKNVAIAGAGVISNLHLHALKTIPSLRVAAICDKDQTRAETTARKWNVPHTYTDFSVMLENEKPSLASILTSPQSHTELCLKAATLGVNMVVEKPLTLGTSGALLILDALKTSNVKLTVVYHYLFSRAMSRALKMVESGSIGQPIEMDVVLMQTPNDPMTSNQHHWCHSIPGGRFGEMLPHPVYLLQAIMGNGLRIETVLTDKRGSFPWMPVDELHVLVRGQNAIGRIYVSFNSSRPVELLRIHGTKKLLTVDLTTQTVVVLGPTTTGKLASAGRNLSVSTRLVLATGINAFRFFGSGWGDYAIQQTYLSILNSISNGVEPLVTPTFAFETVRLTEEICKRI